MPELPDDLYIFEGGPLDGRIIQLTPTLDHEYSTNYRRGRYKDRGVLEQNGYQLQRRAWSPDRR